jgi:hypothetical protein
MTWTAKATSTSTATPAQVWAHWTDVENWHEWDHEVVSSSLKGPFEVGTSGALKSRGGPPVRFILTEVTPLVGFSNVSRLPLATVEFHHTVSADGEGSRIEHRVVMRGPMTFFFKRVIGTKIERGLPQTVASLARAAAASLRSDCSAASLLDSSNTLTKRT